MPKTKTAPKSPVRASAAKTAKSAQSTARSRGATVAPKPREAARTGKAKTSTKAKTSVRAAAPVQAKKPAKVAKAVPDATLPATIARSDRHAQSLWRKTRASAIKTYGDGAQARRAAFSALKHEYEKQGSRWVRKPEKGPSDAQAARGPTTSPRSTETPARTGRGRVVHKAPPSSSVHAKSSGR